MNGLEKFLPATFLSAAMLFTNTAQAMEIQQFDKMAESDQKEHIVELIQGAEKIQRLVMRSTGARTNKSGSYANFHPSKNVGLTSNA